MRATTIMTLGLAAPVFSKDFQYTCDYLSKTDRGAVPDKLKFRDCLGVDINFGSLEAKNLENEDDLFPFPHGCQGCKWDPKECSINCRCKNKDGTLAYPNAVHLDIYLSNYDGTIASSFPQCRSKRVSC